MLLRAAGIWNGDVVYSVFVLINAYAISAAKGLPQLFAVVCAALSGIMRLLGETARQEGD